MEISEDTLLGEILSNAPSASTLFLILSRMKKEGRLDRVIEECASALEAHPENITIRRLLAETCFETGRVPQAESELSKIITHIDDLVPLYLLQARALVRQEREDEAVEALKLYLAHRPDDEEGLRLFETLRPTEIISGESASPPEKEAFPVEDPTEQAIGLPETEGPEDMATPDMAEDFFRQGNITDAIEVYERVMTLNPEDSESMRRLEELKEMLLDRVIEEKRREDAIEKKERMIGVLEKWLANIREQSGRKMTVT